MYIKSTEPPSAEIDTVSLISITEVNKQAQADQKQYRLALRKLSAMFDNPPKLGTAEGERFEALISFVEKYESELLPAPSAK